MRSGFGHGPSPSYNRGFSRSPYLHNGYRNGFRNGFHGRFHDHGRFRDHNRFRNRLLSNCFGYGCWGYPWWGGYYDPWLWSWDYDDARFDADYNNNLAQANEMNEESLEQQRMLRQEEADGDQDVYARSNRSRDPAPTQTASAAIMPSTVLVFRDHHQQEIQNYAIVGQTLWVFTSPHNQKVPLAELDLQATEKANDDRGVAFQVPGLGVGQ